MLGKLDFKTTEKKWTTAWEKSGVYSFNPKSDKPVYSIDSPPPFTSGALHMGHILSYAYFDFAARYKRMMGYNVFFPQGWDCQGFPTEIKVEKKYGRNMPRSEFKKKCIEFTKENITAMKSQMKDMGFSPDWALEYRTMDADYHRRVQYSLLKMLEAGKVYRGNHPVQFCTNCVSAIAKAELNDVERETKLNYLSFKADDGALEIATTRPELLHACVAVLVNPNDKKNAKWIGKTLTVPLHGQQVQVIADKDVDAEFGTGAVMVCTFGDKTDVVWTYRHNLPVVEALDEHGKLLNAGDYSGLSVAKAREKILEDLNTQGLLLKQERLQQIVKAHDRCGKMSVEFQTSKQWFIKLKGSEEKIINAGRGMRWIPDFALQYLIDWAEFIEYDWVISRNRIYGTPLPFYYCNDCNAIKTPPYDNLPVDPSKDAWKGKCECGGEIVGETMTCDVWVDSSISPLVIAGWPDSEGTELFNKIYPASLRPQGLEIIRTWAFYTISRCLELTGQAPFKDMLINGNVLGTDGKKMSKSVGNYEDPNALLQRYPADALRQWAALSGAFAKDRPFNYKDVDRSKAFLTKYYNASRFIEKALEGFKHSDKKLELRETDKWLHNRLAQTVKQCGEAMKNYEYYVTINAIHDFFWHDLCDYYLEEVKYRVYGDDVESKRAAQATLLEALSTATRLLAPFAPFMTEEVYSEVVLPAEGKKASSVHRAEWPSLGEEYINEKADYNGETLHFILSEIRRFKASAGLALNEEISLVEVTLPEPAMADTPLFEEEIREVGMVKKVSFMPGEERAVKVTV